MIDGEDTGSADEPSYISYTARINFFLKMDITQLSG